MHSYGHFKPGVSANTSRIIKYAAHYNTTQNPCFCIPNKYDKNTPGSDSSSARVSNAIRVAQVVQYTRGGKPQYGNFYLGKPLDINYLGRIAGMPGGSGMPPLNRF